VTDTPEHGQPTEDDLRPIISELREIRNRCRSLGNRNEEFPEMARHVDRLLSQLASGRDARGLPVDYRDIARQLFPVTHLFESVGFLAEGRTIADLEKRLMALVPDDAPPLPPAPPPVIGPSKRPRHDPDDTPPRRFDDEPTDGRDDLEPGRRMAPTRPIAGAALLALVVIVVCAWIILRHDPAAHLPEPTPQPTATATPAPTATPTPRSETIADRLERERRERLLEAVAAARRELAAGDVDRAVGNLNEAAAIDPTPGVVVDTASEVVERLLGLARSAADATHWDEAASRLEQARTLARRFSLDDTPVRQAEAAVAAAPRFRLYTAGSWQGLAAEAGRRAVVELSDGARVEGTVGSADASRLVLVRRDQVGSTGGVIHYEEEIPLDRIREVRIYDR
jgi:hypothetical protein